MKQRVEDLDFGSCSILVRLIICLAWFGGTARGAERADEFVTGLTERGMFDMALDYLDRMESSQLVDAEFRQRIPYHRSQTRIDQARRAATPAQRMELLGDARKALDAFLSDNSQSQEAADLQGRLAGSLVEFARSDLARLTQLPDQPAVQQDRQQLATRARQLIAEARQLHAATETHYTAELAKLPKSLDPRKDKEKHESREQLRARLAQSRVLAAETGYYLAQTYSPDSREFKELNEESAAQLGALFGKYSRWLVGFIAHLYEGRCYQAIGKYQQAAGCYEDIISSDTNTNPAFRELLASAHRYRAECLIAEDQFDAAISSCQTWLSNSRGAEDRKPAWLGVRYQLAEALRRKGGLLDEQDAGYRSTVSDARAAYQVVSKHPGEFQAKARSALSLLGQRSDRAAEPRTFSEAFALGKAALSDMQSAQLAVRSAQMRASQDAAQTPAAATGELAVQIETAAAEAIRQFALALTLTDADTELAQRNEARYYLAWLYWQQHDYYRAAVLGEFVGRRYPDHASARAAAKVAMSAYERLFSAAAGQGADESATEFAAARLARLAEFITRRWPGTRDSESAFTVLLNFALRHDRIDEAKKMLAEVAPAQRARMELKLGNAMWGEYLRQSNPSNTSASGDSTPANGAPERLREDAVELLQSGLQEARQSSGQVDQLTAVSTLYLVQARLSQGNYDEAIRLLEEPQHGPLPLIEQRHRVASDEDFATEVYKAALRAYVSVMPPRPDAAVKVMQSLEKLVADDANAAQRLTRIYIGLGVQLQQQMEELRSAGRMQEADRVTAAFAEFLSRVGDRQEGASWASRSWIAETYYTLGQGLSEAQKSQSDRLEFFNRARDAYEQMIAAAAENPDFAPSPAAVVAARKRLGECQREVGDYKGALNTFSSILKEKETRLDVQVAAAYTYQQRGLNEDPRWLERAIFGGYRLRSTGKNRVWGWVRLAQVADRAARTNPKFRDTFFEAWLNAARCRFEAGRQANGADRQENVAKAEEIIRSLERLYPDFSGEPWRAEFERLKSQIEVHTAPS